MRGELRRYGHYRNVIQCMMHRQHNGWRHRGLLVDFRMIVKSTRLYLLRVDFNIIISISTVVDSLLGYNMVMVYFLHGRVYTKAQGVTALYTALFTTRICRSSQPLNLRIVVVRGPRFICQSLVGEQVHSEVEDRAANGSERGLLECWVVHICRQDGVITHDVRLGILTAVIL